MRSSEVIIIWNPGICENLPPWMRWSWPQLYSYGLKLSSSSYNSCQWYFSFNYITSDPWGHILGLGNWTDKALTRPRWLVWTDWGLVALGRLQAPEKVIVFSGCRLGSSTGQKLLFILSSFKSLWDPTMNSGQGSYPHSLSYLICKNVEIFSPRIVVKME